MLINWRRRKKKRIHPATLLFFGVVLAGALTSCGQNGEIQIPTLPPEGITVTIPTPTGTATITATPSSTGRAPTVTITPEKVCTEMPTSIPPTETSSPTLTPTNAPPQPTPQYGGDLIAFVENPIPTPVPSPTTQPTPEPTLTPHPNAYAWTDTEKGIINLAAISIARRLKQTMEDSYGWVMSENDAFHLVYGPTVTFTKTGWTCQQDTGHKGCWAETQGSNLIYVFTHADIIDHASSYHWATHELGHAFVNRVGSAPVDALDFAINEKSKDHATILKYPHLSRPPVPEPGEEEVFWGFAGGHYDWQNSWSTHTSEVFADMFTGWVYDSWEEKRTGGLTDDGQDRKDFMDNKMPSWIKIATEK